MELTIVTIVNGAEVVTKGGYSAKVGDKISFRLCFKNIDGKEVPSPIPSYRWEIVVRSTDGVLHDSRGNGGRYGNIFIPRKAGKIFVVGTVWARMPDTGRYGLDSYTNSMELRVVQ